LKHFLHIRLLCVCLKLCKKFSFDNFGWVGAESGVPNNFGTIRVKIFDIGSTGNTSLSDWPITEGIIIVVREELTD
jgi:hypothetical protein